MTFIIKIFIVICVLVVPVVTFVLFGYRNHELTWKTLLSFMVDMMVVFIVYSLMFMAVLILGSMIVS